MALHYAALHLRLGVEHLWFQIFRVARGAILSRAEYDKALNNATKLYKLIDSMAPNYRKFAEFDQIISSVDSQPHPPTIVWDIDKLKRIHGECGNRLLHFGGIPDAGYLSSAWTEDHLRFLSDSTQWMWRNMTTRGNLIVYRPEGLKPQTHAIWEAFRKGEIDEESTRLRLKIIQPILAKHPQPQTG